MESQTVTSQRGQTITLHEVTKRWGETKSLRGINLTIPAGKFTAILGPSGCGKSTTLRIIAGLEQATGGTVEIGGTDVTNQPPAKRRLSMVFQNYALFPHLSVEENIVFGLRVEKLKRVERKKRLAEVTELLELGDYLKRKPAALSGGQQQRVALGRAIISRRPVCLMDEPLSNLDARLRDGTRREIRSLQQELGFTMVYVTHDQTEAITMADQVVIMNEGQIEQTGSPQAIYQQPQTVFSAKFIGNPPMNLIDGELLSHQYKGLTIGIRPEDLSISNNGPLQATITATEYLGADLQVEMLVGNNTVLARTPFTAVQDRRSIATGQTVSLNTAPANWHVFDTQTGKRIQGDVMSA